MNAKVIDGRLVMSIDIFEFILNQAFQVFFNFWILDCWYAFRGCSCLTQSWQIQYLATILGSQFLKYSHSLQPVFLPQIKHFNSMVENCFASVLSSGILTASATLPLTGIVVVWTVASLHVKCIAAFAELDQQAIPGEMSLPHSMHLLLKVIRIWIQSVIWVESFLNPLSQI